MANNSRFGSPPTTAVINQYFGLALSWSFRNPQTTTLLALPMPAMVFLAYSLSTVVQVAAEAGVGFYFRCARCTTLWVTDCLCEFRRNTKHIWTQSPNNSCCHLACSMCNFALMQRSAQGRSFFPYLAAQLL